MLNNRRIVCPFCREPTELPGNNIKSLHKNFSLIQVIQLMSKTTEVEVSTTFSSHVYSLFASVEFSEKLGQFPTEMCGTSV